MSKPQKTVLQAVLPIIVLFLTGLMTGCESASTGPGNNVPSGYRLEGAVVKDLSRGQVNSSSRLALDGKTVSSARITLAGDTIPFSGSPDSLYMKSQVPVTFYSAGPTDLVVVDGASLADTVPTIITDSFNITFIDPTFGFWRPSDGNVFLQWTAVSNIDGYAWGVVKAGSEYTGKGFAGYVLLQNGPNTTIPPYVFNLDTGAGTIIDTGLHNIYIYAYSGSPDSALSSTLLPVPLLSQKPDNIKKSKFVGRFGSITVSKPIPLWATEMEQAPSEQSKPLLHK